MGIQAPSSSDQFTLVVSSLISYNRPLIILAVSILLGAVAYFVTKKNLALSILTLVLTGLLVSGYFVLTATSSIRY